MKTETDKDKKKRNPNFIRSFKREALVKLDADEMKSIGRRVKAAHAELEQAEKDFADMKGAQKQKIREIEKKRDRLIDAGSDGDEMRLVDHHEEFQGDMIITYRDDTNAVVGDPEPAKKDDPRRQGKLEVAPGQHILDDDEHEKAGKGKLSIAAQKGMNPEPDEDGDIKPTATDAAPRAKGRGKGKKS